MGAAGSPVAIEAAHIALMREDWRLVPEVLRVARRTMGAVRFNLGFTAIYNLTGLSLATAGVLPPVIAAAAQSLPDFGILGNSARLLRQRRHRSSQQRHGAAVDPVRSSDPTPALRQGVQATWTGALVAPRRVPRRDPTGMTILDTYRLWDRLFWHCVVEVVEGATVRLMSRRPPP